jgi:restriction endonuclease S subunit
MRWLSQSGYFLQFAHGTTVPRLYKPDVMKSPISVPSLSEQTVICNRLDDLLAALEAAASRSVTLSTLLRGFREMGLEGVWT